jgi:hypothetical protein
LAAPAGVGEAKEFFRPACARGENVAKEVMSREWVKTDQNGEAIEQMSRISYCIGFDWYGPEIGNRGDFDSVLI